MAVREFEVLEIGDSVTKRGTTYASLRVVATENDDIVKILEELEAHGFEIEKLRQDFKAGVYDKVSGKYTTFYIGYIDVRKEGRATEAYKILQEIKAKFL